MVVVMLVSVLVLVIFIDEFMLVGLMNSGRFSLVMMLVVVVGLISCSMSAC